MKPDETDIPDLTPAQLLALAALLEGASVADAAERAGVSRVTLWRWCRSGPLADELARHVAEATDRLRGLAGAACDVVQHHLAQNNLAAALAVLKGCGALTTSTRIDATVNTSCHPVAVVPTDQLADFEPPPGVHIILPDNGRDSA